MLTHETTSSIFLPTASIIADSTANEARLTTMEITFHRFILPEFNTHRMFSRNGASSRAIPVSKNIALAKTANVQPLHWGLNRPGMQATDEAENTAACAAAWNVARARAIDVAEYMANDLHLHKQVINRILEPYLPTTMLVTGTSAAYSSFFSQRNHPDSAPEMQALAAAMQAVYIGSQPTPLFLGQWHLPFYSHDLAMLPLFDCLLCCTARCARVSYNNHHGERSVADDLRLGHMLQAAVPPHLSPFEHTALFTSNLVLNKGNFSGTPFLQFRKMLEAASVTSCPRQVVYNISQNTHETLFCNI